MVHTSPVNHEMKEVGEFYNKTSCAKAELSWHVFQSARDLLCEKRRYGRSIL